VASLYERVKSSGCAVAELPNDCAPRRWGKLASERIIVGLSELTVVVEAEERPHELASARIARDLGRKVAAVPGRVTSPLSRGTHALLVGGAELVRGPEDVLELLCRVGPPGASGRGRPSRNAAKNLTAPAALEPRLRQTLERVGAGEDTPDKLTGSGTDTDEVLLALSELEVMGLLARGDGGRYVPRDPLRGLADAGANASGSAAVRP
jgi:DNA processing protein